MLIKYVHYCLLRKSIDTTHKTILIQRTAVNTVVSQTCNTVHSMCNATNSACAHHCTGYYSLDYMYINALLCIWVVLFYYAGAHTDEVRPVNDNHTNQLGKWQQFFSLLRMWLVYCGQSTLPSHLLVHVHRPDQRGNYVIHACTNIDDHKYSAAKNSNFVLMLGFLSIKSA